MAHRSAPDAEQNNKICVAWRLGAETVDNDPRAALNTASRTTKLATQVANFDGRPAQVGHRSRKSAAFSICGGVPEWSNGAVSKTVVRFAYRGFESHPLRQQVLDIQEKPSEIRTVGTHGGSLRGLAAGVIANVTERMPIGDFIRLCAAAFSAGRFLGTLRDTNGRGRGPGRGLG